MLYLLRYYVHSVSHIQTYALPITSNSMSVPLKSARKVRNITKKRLSCYVKKQRSNCS
jgi:hypothetical protein